MTNRDLRSKDPHSSVRPNTTAPSLALRVMPVQACTAAEGRGRVAIAKMTTPKRLLRNMTCPSFLSGTASWLPPSKPSARFDRPDLGGPLVHWNGGQFVFVLFWQGAQVVHDGLPFLDF